MVNRWIINGWDSGRLFGGLVAASLIVAVAIGLDGTASRAVNGVGGVLWMLCAFKTVAALRRERPFWLWAVVLAVILVTIFVIRPNQLLVTVPTFVVAGFLVAALPRRERTFWALAVPAIWLPVHLIVSIGRAALRDLGSAEASMRTDPPPTPALVPFMMVMAAWVGANIAEAWSLRDGQEKTA